MVRVRVVAVVAALVSVVLAPSCAAGSPRADASPGKLTVVAAEDFWGSIARQLGGARVDVESLVANPDADPHDYEPTPRDGRAVASARLVVTEGIGYDSWIDKLVDANRSSGRAVLDVGDLVGLKEGANPHQWYSPTTV